MRTCVLLSFIFFSSALVAQTELKITASDAAAGDLFGASVGLSNNTALIGASDENSRGAAYVYMRNQGGSNMWGEVIKIGASDGASGDSFGAAVAIDGDIAVVGNFTDADMGADTGSAYIFSRDQGGLNMWGQVTKLTASDAAMGDRFGVSVAIHGDTVVIGADMDSDGMILDGGAAYVFYRDQGGTDMWGELTKITPSDASDDDGFGTSVSISNDTLVVGAPFNDPGIVGDGGAAYVFLRNQGGSDNWGEIQKLVSSDVAATDFFGGAVSVDGDTAIIGAPRPFGIGSAYVFSRDQGGVENWGEVTIVTAADGASGDSFGISVSLRGDTALIGAYFDSPGGSAYFFSRDQGGANNWGEISKIVGMDTASSDQFGRSVAVDGGTAVISAPLDDDAGMFSGSAYMLYGSPVPVELQRFSVD